MTLSIGLGAAPNDGTGDPLRTAFQKVNTGLRNTLIPTAVQTANYTATAGDLVMTNTATIGAFTVALPPTPAAGEQVAVLDVPNNWPTANVTLARNGSNIDGAASDLPLNGGIYVLAIYTGDAAIGWRIV